jgi:hypothetical protein
MATVIGEVDVEAVEALDQTREARGQGGQKPGAGKPKLDPFELAATLRRQEARLRRLWAD